MKLQPIQGILLIMLLSILLAGLSWANYQFALANPGGTDFLVHWVGARALLHGETPYSDKTALEIQKMVYGRPAQPGEHELRVAYPIYSAIIFGPFALISNFTLARSLWMTFLEVIILGTSLLALKVIGWQPRVLTLSLFITFSLFWYHAVRPLINGNAVAVVAFLFVAVIWAIQNKRDALAGALLAFSTIKPQLALLPALFMLLWTLSQQRWRFIAWFFASLALLVVAGMMIIPAWPLQNLAEIMRYTGYNPPTTVGAALESWWPGLGRQLGWLVSIGMAGILFWEWKGVRHSDPARFLWIFSLTLVASQWIGITTDPGNFIVLVLPLVIVLKSLDDAPNGRMWLSAVLAVLLLGLWVLFLLTLPPGSQQQSPIMFFPLPLFLLIGLYFCRPKYIGPAPHFPNILEEP